MPAYAASRISFNLKGSAKRFGWLQASLLTNDTPAHLHLRVWLITDPTVSVQLRYN
jgi:hypothetical protein